VKEIFMTKTATPAASPAPETKSAPSAEITGAFHDFMEAFEAFKETNDERLGQIETRMSADIVTSDKLERIDRTLDELQLKQLRPALYGGNDRTVSSPRHKAAFDGYVRKGEVNALRSLESKALSVGSDPDGGYLVPEDVERTINRSLRNVSPIRAISSVRQVSGSVFKKPYAVSGLATGWVAEAAVRPQTATPTLSELSFPTMELYAMPAATAALLDDSAVDIEAWIADEVRIIFAEQEGTAFVTGDGVNKPKGFLTYPKVANASWTWGNSGYLVTGAAGAFPAANASDKLIDLVYALRAPYRANANFVMNRSVQSAVRKLKDAQGNYLWMPAQKPGEQPTLMGYAIAETEDMPDIAADAYALAFGDFNRGYLVVDRVGIRILRDPYSSKPYVLFYTTKRVGGGMQDFDAIKLLKFGTA
jgi:HK97 family phage major capsid protein